MIVHFKINKSASSVILNIIYGFIRCCIFLQSSRIAYGIILFKIPQVATAHTDAFQKFTEWYVIAFTLILASVSIYDTLCGGTSPLGLSNYFDRVKLSKFLEILGFKANYTSNLIFRPIIWLSLTLANSLIDIDYTTFYLDLGKSEFFTPIKMIFGDFVFLVAIAIFIGLQLILSIPNILGCKTPDSLLHPWASPLTEDQKQRPVRDKIGIFGAFLFILNISQKMLFLMAFINSLNVGDYHYDTWNINDVDPTLGNFLYARELALIAIPALVLLSLIREIQIVYSENSAFTISSIYIFDSFYNAFLISISYLYLQGEKTVIYLVYLALLLLINIVVIIALNPRRFCFVLIYGFKKIFSREFCLGFSIFAFYFISIVSGILFSTSYFKRWFKIDIVFCEFMQKMIDAKNAMMKVLEDAFNGIMFLITFGNSDAALLAICILVILVFIILLVMVILPFAIGAGGYPGYNIANQVRNFKKIANTISRQYSSFKSINKYMKKFDDLVKPPAVDIGDILGWSLFFLSMGPFMLFAIAIAIAFWERIGGLPKEMLVMFFILMVVCMSTFTSFMLLIKYLICREFPLGILSVFFRVTKYFKIVILSNFLSILAIFILIGNYFYSKNSKMPNNSRGVATAEGEINRVNNFPLSSENITEDKPRSYLLRDLCNSLNPCSDAARNSRETPGQILHLIKENICPCYKTTDKRNVCKYKISEAFPCMHRGDQEDFFRRHKPIDCCCCQIDCACDDYLKNGVIDLSQMGRIALTHIYILMLGIIVYLAYYSFMEKNWYSVKTSLGPILTAILGDSGPSANKNQYNSQSNEEGSICAGDLAAIIALFMASSFKNIKDSNPKFKVFLDKLKEMGDAQGVNTPTLILNLFAKVVLLIPAAISGTILLVVPTFGALSRQLNFELIAMCTGCSITLSGMCNMIEFSFMINGIFAFIPFIDVFMIYAPGWLYGFAVYVMLVLAYCFYFIDYTMPPVPLLRSADLDDQIFADDEDLDDPLHMNKYLKESERVVGNFFVNNANDEYDFAL